METNTTANLITNTTVNAVMATKVTIYHCETVEGHNSVKCCKRCHALGMSFSMRAGAREYALCCHVVGKFMDNRPDAMMVRDLDGELVAG